MGYSSTGEGGFTISPPMPKNDVECYLDDCYNWWLATPDFIEPAEETKAIGYGWVKSFTSFLVDLGAKGYQLQGEAEFTGEDGEVERIRVRPDEDNPGSHIIEFSESVLSFTDWTKV